MQQQEFFADANPINSVGIRTVGLKAQWSFNAFSFRVRALRKDEHFANLQWCTGCCSVCDPHNKKKIVRIWTPLSLAASLGHVNIVFATSIVFQCLAIRRLPVMRWIVVGDLHTQQPSSSTSQTSSCLSPSLPKPGDQQAENVELKTIFQTNKKSITDDCVRFVSFTV